VIAAVAAAKDVDAVRAVVGQGRRLGKVVEHPDIRN